ncbi:RagB/SusD family nutrient uptake outer membrane protein [Xanthocytophaga flava]|uniref:RagB/SusD family nutrient uptake outer membrane protein n=1 Tax=Xanthocytophaga flava TaxID=3048013 RepID=UPI0028D7262F|nr:RagB/SusD family nutrient uptake outer membrane protein [Xanthocytophaga flavus]MDJ1473335.1 RagB/SusD family nutrient uptake outer membrane protein [Xanthocytophaga flavus]
MKKITLSLLAAGLLLASSCSNDALDIKNQNAYSDATYFKTATQFNEAVIATYSVFLHQGMYSRDWYFLFDLLGNDAERDAPLLGDLLQLHDYSYGTTQQQITSLWGSLYRMIYRANLVIDKAGQWSPELPEEITKKNQYLAEAHFLKGFAEFQLVALWGRVPLRPDYFSSTAYAAPRATIAEGWEAVEADLKAAIEGLPVTYASADLGRATQGAAIALLGKAYLYQKKYALASTELEKLTKPPFAYALNPNFDNQFSESNGTSPETVFDIPHKWVDAATGQQTYYFGGQEAWGGLATHSGRAQEYGWNDWRNVFISNAAVQAFTYLDEEGESYTDPRAKLTFYGDAASGGDTDFCQTCPASKITPLPSYAANSPNGGPFPYPFEAAGYRWRKYENYEVVEQFGGPQSNINSQVIRFADVLLLLAESYIQQSNMEAALPLINQVRVRVNAFPYTQLGNQTEAMKLLMRERQLELCGEQSRWFDLNRWGIAKQTINPEKQAAIGSQPLTDKYLLLPIPEAEKLTNSAVASDIADDWN